MSLTAAIEQPTLRVGELITEESGLKLAAVAGRGGLESPIRSARIQKPGLALHGAARYVHEGRVQILGKSEIEFLQDISRAEQAEVFRSLAGRRPACFLVTRRLAPPDALLEVAEETDIPVLVSSLVSSVLIDRLTHFLEDRLAPRTQLHGVLLDVYGLGVLLRGESGIGKSEAALDLVVRGHRLVADDVVSIRRIGNDVLLGTGPELLRHHMEIRGLGIINIKDLFGVAAVRDEKAVDLVVDLTRWESPGEVDRLGLDSHQAELLEVSLPLLTMPVAPGRSVAILIEVASRNHLMMVRGHHATRELLRKVELARGKPEEPEGG